MPNWCNTTITINNKNEKELKDFESKIKEWTSHDYKENGFGLKWLGNIVGNSGIGTIDENQDTDLSCRGWLTDIDNLGSQLLISTETAWVPMLQMWVKLLEKYMPEAELIYQAEEPGLQMYVTNDSSLESTYVLDIFDPVDKLEEIESNWEIDGNSLKEILQDLLETKEDNLDKLISLFKESDYGEHANISEWEYVESYEFD